MRERPNEISLLLVTDSSDEAFAATEFFMRTARLHSLARVKALLVRLPRDPSDAALPIREPELACFERFAQLLAREGAIVEGERGSGASADVLAHATAIDASMIVLALAQTPGDHRGDRLLAQIVESCSLPVIALRGANWRSA